MWRGSGCRNYISLPSLFLITISFWSFLRLRAWLAGRMSVPCVLFEGCSAPWWRQRSALWCFFVDLIASDSSRAAPARCWLGFAAASLLRTGENGCMAVCSRLLMQSPLSVNNNNNNEKAIILVITSWDTGVQVTELQVWKPASCKEWCFKLLNVPCYEGAVW